MKNLENFGVQELDTKEITKIEGGFLFSSSGLNWGNFWRGMTIGAASGGAGAAAYYAYT